MEALPYGSISDFSHQGGVKLVGGKYFFNDLEKGDRK